MKIASFVKQSFIDWPGKTVAVIFTKGCNFRCGYCHNPSLVLPKLMYQTEDMAEQTIFDYLKNRQKWLDGIVITGGEPTIQNDLLYFIIKVKKLNYPVKLDTNGSKPELLELLIKNKFIDFIEMDIKNILTEDTYQNIVNIPSDKLIIKIKQSLKLIRTSDIPHRFRTTIIPKHHTAEIQEELKKQFKQDNYIQQSFREGETIASYLQ